MQRRLDEAAEAEERRVQAELNRIAEAERAQIAEAALLFKASNVPEPGFSAEVSFSQIVELCSQKPTAKLLAEIKQVAQSAIAFLSEGK